MTSADRSASQLVDGALEGADPARLLLAVDFDGTLSDIVTDPDSARPRPRSLWALEQLTPLVLKVAIVSGRGKENLARLLPIPDLILLGDYGLGQPTQEEVSALADFNAEAAHIVLGLEGVTIEAKPASTSIHFRRAPDLQERGMEMLVPVATRLGLRAGRGRMVLEVRPARAGKGRAVARLVDQLRPGSVVVAGDDEGDREAFEYVAGLQVPHLAVGVDSKETGAEVFEHCDVVLPGPAALSSLLSALARWAARPGPAGPGAGG